MNTYNHVGMRDIPRSVRFPFPAQSFGYILDSAPSPLREMRYTDKFEFCIRLRSNAAHMRERINGKMYKTPYPNLAIKLPFATRVFDVTDHRDAFYVIYDASLLEPMKRAGLSMEPPVREIRLTRSVLELIERLKELMRISCERGAAEKIDALCFMLVEELLLQQTDRNESDSSSRRKALSVASWLKLHYSERFSLKEIVLRNGLSERSFFRAWRECFDVSPVDFVRNLRMEHAEKTLMRQKELSISETAEILGYANTSHFIKIFKKIKGVTPGKFRAAHSATANVPDTPHERIKNRRCSKNKNIKEL